jgi:hypothetical protein
VLSCAGCNAEVVTVAWKPDIEYKLSSYFRLRRGHEHEINCNIGGYEEFVNSGKQQIRSAADIPGGYPARLLFRKPEKLIEPRNSQVPAKDRYVYGNARISDGSRSTRSGNTTTSLLQVCRFYVNVPEGRKPPFRAEGIEGATYNEVFQSLHFFTIERLLPPKIYYGSLMFKVKPERSFHSLLLTLVQKIKGNNERHYRLEICWKDWSEARKTNFSNLIDVKREFLREQWFQEKQSPSPRQPQPNVFFIGDQSADDRSVFRVCDPRTVCILA